MIALFALIAAGFVLALMGFFLTITAVSALRKGETVGARFCAVMALALFFVSHLLVFAAGAQ